MRTIIASFVLLPLLTLVLAGATDDAVLRSYNPNSRLVFYRSPQIVMQAARFEISRPGHVQRLTIMLGGAAKGSATVHIFGYEAGLPAPIVERDLVPPIRIRKTRAGVEKIVVELPAPAPIEHHHFFVAIDSITSGVTLLSDNQEKQPSCESANERYLFQFLKYADGTWRSGTYAYAIEATIDYRKMQSKPIMADVTAETTIEDSIRHNHGIAWADADRDGDLDLLFDGRLQRNDGAGTFTDVTGTAGISGAPRAQAYIDANNDGYLDLLFLGSADSANPASFLFLNDRHGAFTRHDLDLPKLIDPTSFAVADANRDNYLDVFVGQGASDGMPSRGLLLINDNGRGFRDGTSLLTDDSSSAGCVGSQWIDVDADAVLELYVARANGAHELWRRGADGAYRATVSPAAAGGPSVAGCDWRDYDGDGDPDLLLPTAFLPRPLPRTALAGNSIYRNAGAPGYELRERGEEEIDRDTRQAGGSWGDVNNDRLPDFVMTTSSDCRYLSIYEQTPDGRFAPRTFEHGLQRIAGGPDAVWVDYDGDGRLDMATIVDGRLRLFRNVGASANNFVELDFSAAGSASTVGASVTVHAGGVAQTQSISSGNGLLMQRPLRLHFGLGGASKVDSVEIRWNGDGARPETITGLAANEIHRLGTGAAFDGAGTTALSASPNPFASELTITYSVPAAQHVTLAIYSLQGELVRTLVDEVRPAGEHRVVWEAKGADGTRMAQGVYTYRLTTPEADLVRKVVLTH